jgi:glycerate kinase
VARLEVVIAPDSFKGSVDAARAARAMADGWRSVRPDDAVRELPQADGGEGTLDVIASAVPGSAWESAGPVTGPDGRPADGRWLRLPDGTAVVEMAAVSGLPGMRELDPLGATSRGLGEVIAAALDTGAERLVIGIGGSASTDGGLPVLEALDGRRPPVGGATVLTDVTAPLLGPAGAAAVFGPQKGATPAQVAELEARLRAVAETLGGDPDRPGAGAAGGVGFALAHWGAELVPGSAHVARLTGLDRAIAAADVVITGEGRFDGSSTTGKVVGGVLVLAEGVRSVGVVAGQLAADPSPAWAISLSELAGSPAAAMGDPLHWLVEAGVRAAASAP